MPDGQPAWNPQRALAHAGPPLPAVPRAGRAGSLPDRTWPDKRITKAPLWCAVDLRDGNQALIDPMSPARKRRMFELLVRMGYKEIEVGFPAASQTDFDFVREIIEQDADPGRRHDPGAHPGPPRADRAHLRGLRGRAAGDRAPVQLDVDPAAPGRLPVRTARASRKIATDGAEDVLRFSEKYPDTDWRFEYSPESYTGTELEYAVEVCNAVSRDLAADAGLADGRQPAGDRRDGHARTSTPTRSSGCTATWSAATGSCCRCTRTTTAAPASPPPSWATRPAPTGSRAACSATASAPATSTW